MNEDQFEGKWGRMKGSIRAHWGRLTDDDVEQIRGKRDRMLAKLQERYGHSRDVAAEKLREFEKKF